MTVLSVYYPTRCE